MAFAAPESMGQVDASEGDAALGELVQQLAGHYYEGDGLGMNLYLTLHPDGSFACDWYGCMGKYGECRGEWTVRGNRIVMATVHALGVFEDSPLDELIVGRHEGALVLVQAGDIDYFLETGPTRYTCFQRRESAASPGRAGETIDLFKRNDE